MRPVFILTLLSYVICARTSAPTSTQTRVSSNLTERTTILPGDVTIINTTTATTSITESSSLTPVPTSVAESTTSYLEFVLNRNRSKKEKIWGYQRTKTNLKRSKSTKKKSHRPKKKSKKLKKHKQAARQGKSAVIGDREKDLNRPVKKKCLSCDLEEKRKLEKLRKESFKMQIVNKLKLDLTKKVSIPKIDPEVLRRNVIKDESHKNDNYVDVETTEVILLGKDITHFCHDHKSTGCFKFNLKNQIPGHVTHAELMVYKLNDPNDGQQSFIISELSRSIGLGNLTRTNMVTRLDTDIKQGWLSFPVGKTVRKWAEHPSTNNGLAIKCKSCARKSHRQLYNNKQGYKPVLIIHIAQHSRRRYKRAGVDCGVNVNRCCKHHLTINLHDIGLYRIIEPEEITANYCTGLCNQHVEGQYNNTEYLKILMYHSETANDTIREAVSPCCGAVRLSSRSMLYVTDDGQMQYSLVHNLEVEECGCL